MSETYGALFYDLDLRCKMTFGANLKNALMKRHISIQAVADDLELSSTAPVYRWIKGEAYPKPTHIYQICMDFDIPVNELFFGHEFEADCESDSLPLLFRQSSISSYCLSAVVHKVKEAV